MITYLYWTLVFALTLIAVYVCAGKLSSWRSAMLSAAIILFVGWAAYFFYFQQIFVKRWGGVMNVSVPDGQRHLGVTWKDDHLWIESFDPANNTCEFREYSRGDLLQGRVIIKNCNPL